MKICVGIAGQGKGLICPCRKTDRWEDQQKGKMKKLQMHDQPHMGKKIIFMKLLEYKREK